MTPERYRQLEALCHRAMETPISERAAFVEAACAGDAELRQELQSLLLSYERSRGFLEQPPGDLAAAVMRDLDLHPGARLSHYEIRSRLGAGGMGEVFLAEDLQLRREVALKMLPGEAVADEVRRRRLLLEAQAASSLSHPNVAHIYEIGEAGGVRFIAMEYVPGRTLRDLMRERRLAEPEALDVATQVADALDAAHASGVVHRDIKPANIMLTPRGLVKVLDFGVAKMLSPGLPGTTSDPGQPSSPGALLGTPEYMSPEQALGLAVGPASDVFSFGVLLHEMASGELPFTGRGTTEILDHVIHAAPARLPASTPFARIVDRCLAKEPGRRYPSGKELLADLQGLAVGRPPARAWSRHLGWLGAAGLLCALALAATLPWLPRAPTVTAVTSDAAAAQARIRLAVLPFENLSADPERDYLADSLTEETIASLGQLDPERLSVIGRTSVLAYRHTVMPLSQIGRELDAAYVVESSIRVEASRVRVTARLSRAAEQVQVWSASYDGEPASMLAFQRELGATIAEQIRLRLSPERIAALTRRQTRNPEAYDFYLRGRHLWNQLTPSTTRRAIEAYSRATKLDPDYALAWSGLADAWAAGPMTGDAPPEAAWALARNAAARAAHAEPGLAETQASLGFVEFWFGWDWEQAEADYRRAIALDRSYAFAHRMLGVLLGHAGRGPEAAQEIQRARELDPLDAMQHALSAQVAFVGRDNDAALAFARQAIVVEPHFWVGHYQLAQAHEQQGHAAQALAAAEEAGRLSGGNSKALALRGYILARHGKPTEAREVLRTLEVSDRFVPPYAVALVHAGLGERGQALDWLERSLAIRDVHLVLLPVDPKWDPLRREPRFVELLRRSGLDRARSALPGPAPQTLVGEPDGQRPGLSPGDPAR